MLGAIVTVGPFPFHGQLPIDPLLTCSDRPAAELGRSPCRCFAISTLFRERHKTTDKCRRDRHRLMWQLPQINLVLARVVIPNYVTGIELFVDGGMAQV
jgi:hypothetical protein